MVTILAMNDTIQTLIAELADDDIFIRHKAANRLKFIGADAVPMLIDSMLQGDGRIQWEAARVLCDIRDPRIVQPMMTSLSNDNPILGQIAVKALEQHGTIDAIHALQAALRTCHFVVRISIVTALGHLGARQAIPDIVHLLQTATSASLRLEAVRALGLMNAVEHLDTIRYFINDDDPHVAKRAQAVVAELEATGVDYIPCARNISTN